jgi:preprotein translocase subunit SecE
LSKQVAKTGKKSRFSLFKDIYDELKKVTWPTRREGIRLTIMVIIVCVVLGIFLGAIDLGFSELIKNVFLTR